jgi:hypothetical protein
MNVLLGPRPACECCCGRKLYFMIDTDIDGMAVFVAVVESKSLRAPVSHSSATTGDETLNNVFVNAPRPPL